MKDLNEKCLRFVLHYYQKNKLNTQKALHVFKERNQFTDKPKKKSPFLWIASGAVAAILLFIAIYTWRNTENGWTEIVAYTYPVGYRLPDGSSVTLFPHSSIRFQSHIYQHQKREVRIKGKGFFSVQRNPLRPFTVKGNLSQTDVLGTRFTIDESQTDTAFITVESGKVQWSANKGGETVILSQGMSAQIIKGSTTPEIINYKSNDNNGNDVFHFDNIPLQEALDTLSLYYHVQLKCVNTDKRLTATFEKKSLDEIIGLIEKVLNVNIEKTEK